MKTKTVSTNPAKHVKYNVYYDDSSHHHHIQMDDGTEYLFIEPHEKYYENMFKFVGFALALSAISSIALVIYIISSIL